MIGISRFEPGVGEVRHPCARMQACAATRPPRGPLLDRDPVPVSPDAYTGSARTVQQASAATRALVRPAGVRAAEHLDRCTL